jgi:hypothetical protein
MSATTDRPRKTPAAKTRTDPRPKKRVRRDELPKHVRKVRGGAYQARPWVGPAKDANVNLGLYHPDAYGSREAAIEAAARAAAEFLKRMAKTSALDVWGVLKELKRLTWRYRRTPEGRMVWVAEPIRTEVDVPIVAAHVLPPNVRELPAGGFVAGGRWGEFLLGPFESPEAAWKAWKTHRAAAGLGPVGSHPCDGGTVTVPARLRPEPRARTPAAAAPRPAPDHRSRPADPATERQRIARYLAEVGPTPGDRLAAALRLQLDQFWPLINYRWFDVVTGGWGLTARGRAEGLGGADG